MCVYLYNNYDAAKLCKSFEICCKIMFFNIFIVPIKTTSEDSN